MLIAECLRGDQRAWRLLVERHAGLVNGILHGAFRLSEPEAEDAFQEVFTRLYLRMNTLRDRRALVGWIVQVTRTVAVDFVRRSSHEVAVGTATDETAADDPVRDVLEAMLVREALGSLPPHQQEIVERFFVRDESYQTIADALGIPSGTIASRISRALAALRQQLEGQGAAAVV